MRNCWIYLVLTIFVSCQVLGVAGEPENERVICHSIAVFGGSYSVVPESKIAKDAWRERYGLTITDYGVGGAGFSLLSSVSNIQFQVDNACDETKQVYDAYLLWASTNDYRLCNDRAGVSTDYTIDDGFSTEGRKTQSGGINYCIKRIKEKAPEALILFVSSTPLFDDAKSYSEDYEGMDGMNYFVAMQEACCNKNNVHFLNQYINSPLTPENWEMYFQADGIHLNEDGYRLLLHNQTSFIGKYMAKASN